MLCHIALGFNMSWFFKGLIFFICIFIFFPHPGCPSCSVSHCLLKVLWWGFERLEVKLNNNCVGYC